MNKVIVIVMGYNAAGKSTLVTEFTTLHYHRLNRDLEGGSLDDLAVKAAQLIKGGVTTLVLDNTYGTVKSRESIVKVAKDNNIPIRCIWLSTSMEDAQLNACLRMVRKTGKLLQPSDFKGNKDPNLFPPAALFHYRKEFQKPTTKEGFAAVEEVPFKRVWPKEYVNKALILDYDGTLRESVGEQKYPIELADIKMLPNRTGLLKEYQKKGYRLLGASNQSGVARGVPESKIVACFEETNKRLGVDIEYSYCPHRIPPVSCYCRKPHAGMGAFFIEKYKLNPADCIMVGDMTTDETFAGRCGFKYVDVNEFFK
jgi:D-glycero-D-manno-heptose 1,7-bisphosphate phosphatase